MSDRSLSLCLLAGLLLAAPLFAQVERPLREAEIVTSVVAFLEQGHLSGRQLDDAAAREGVKAFLEDLDPLKVYFLASDIEEFLGVAHSQDDKLKAGDASLAHVIFARFLKRLGERVVQIEELLNGSFDFEKDESFPTEPKSILAAKDAAEMKDRWRRRLKLDLLDLEEDKVTGEEAVTRLRKRYQSFLERMRKENREDVLSRWLNAFASIFDPHTTWMSPKAYEDFSISVTLNYHGIGAVLGEEDGYIVVREVMPGGAAKDQGLIKNGDRIAAVGQGESGEMVDIVGYRTSDAVGLIRGKEGTTVRLAILPADGGARRVDTLPRKKIEVEGRTATAKTIDLAGAEGEEPLKIGVIELPSFYRDIEGMREGEPLYRSSTRDVGEHLKTFRNEGVDVAILDLRANGGGFLPEAIGVAGLFIDRGPVVQVRSPTRESVLPDRDRGVAWDGPLIILTSGVSASASEIVAGALKDWQRALIVGDKKTHGKGTVQSTLDIAEEREDPAGRGALGVIKLTLQQFYLPLGESTQVIGVAADIILPTWYSLLDRGEGSLPNAVPPGRIGAQRIEKLRYVDSSMIEDLAQASAERRAKDSFWGELKQRMEAYQRQRAKETVPLARKAYMAQRAELKAASEELKTEDKDAKLEEDPWMKEVFAIARDYHKRLETRLK